MACRADHGFRPKSCLPEMGAAAPQKRTAQRYIPRFSIGALAPMVKELRFIGICGQMCLESGTERSPPLQGF
jgi:hypothetical protein